MRGAVEQTGGFIPLHCGVPVSSQNTNAKLERIQPASLCKKHDLGPVAVWENKICCKKKKKGGRKKDRKKTEKKKRKIGIRVPPGCGSRIHFHGWDFCHDEKDRERGGKCFILPSLTQETPTPPLLLPLPSNPHFTLPLHSSSSSSCLLPFGSSFHFDSDLISSILP